MDSKPKFGPWSPSGDPTANPVEYKAQLRTLAALVYVYRMDSWPINDLMVLLRKAEFCTDYLEPARRQFDALPSLTQRRIIGTFHTITTWLPVKDDRSLAERSSA